MLSVSQLSVTYGDKPVLKSVDFRLQNDEILMLVGPTGCGKTTILKALAGLISMAAGSIQLGDLNITASDYVPPEKRRIGMVFQDFALFPHLSVIENVAFRVQDPELAHHWLNVLGLADFKERKPDQLSGGQKQRVALARTLAHQPQLILLDEPLSSLDAALKDSVRWEIRNALKAAAIPAIWVTHDQDEALSVGDRIGILNGGQLEQLAEPEICFCEPASRFVAKFLGETSFLSGQLQVAVDGSATDWLAMTSLGEVPVRLPAGAVVEPQAAIDIVLRPDDLVLDGGVQGNAVISWCRYEGGSRLYGLNLSDGTELKSRTGHGVHLEQGRRLQSRIVTDHPLAGFVKT